MVLTVARAVNKQTAVCLNFPLTVRRALALLDLLFKRSDRRRPASAKLIGVGISRSVEGLEDSGGVSALVVASCGGGPAVSSTVRDVDVTWAATA